MTSGLTAGVNISYDEAFDTRVSADIKVRLGGPKTTVKHREVQNLPVISAMTSSPENRDVRVHDGFADLFACNRQSYGVTSESCSRRRNTEQYIREQCQEAKGLFATDGTLGKVFCKNTPPFPKKHN